MRNIYVAIAYEVLDRDGFSLLERSAGGPHGTTARTAHKPRDEARRVGLFDQPAQEPRRDREREAVWEEESCWRAWLR